MGLCGLAYGWHCVWRLRWSRSLSSWLIKSSLRRSSLRRSRSIGKKLAAYIVFYAIILFVLWRGLKPYLEPYPGNWLAIDKEYRELAYELYNLEQDCYGYEGIHKGSHGEIVFSFEEITYHSDHILRSTLEQRDYILINNTYPVWENFSD